MISAAAVVDVADRLGRLVDLPGLLAKAILSAACGNATDALTQVKISRAELVALDLPI